MMHTNITSLPGNYFSDTKQTFRDSLSSLAMEGARGEFTHKNLRGVLSFTIWRCTVRERISTTETNYLLQPTTAKAPTKEPGLKFDWNAGSRDIPTFKVKTSHTY